MVARGKTTLSHTPVLGNAYITSVTCGIKIQLLFILARPGYVIPSDSKYFVFINLSKPLFRQKIFESSCLLASRAEDVWLNPCSGQA